MIGRYVKAFAAAGLLVLTAAQAVAQSGQGPVAQACSAEMEKLCPGKQHGQGEMRSCLESNKDKVSSACKAALDSTGPGSGMGKNRPN
jgi:hypothetical protein